MLKKISAKEGSFKLILSTPFERVVQQASKLFQHQAFELTSYSEPKSMIENLIILRVAIGTIGSQEEKLAKKIDLLVDIMKERNEKRIVIFCNSRTLEQIKTALKTKLNLNPAEYFAKQSSQKRMSAIFQFNYKKANVLLTTELASRGLAFLQPVDSLISFDKCENAQEEIIRMGRSNKNNAEYIIFEEQNNSFSSQLPKLKDNKRIGKYLNNIKVNNIMAGKIEKKQ